MSYFAEPLTTDLVRREYSVLKEKLPGAVALLSAAVGGDQINWLYRARDSSKVFIGVSGSSLSEASRWALDPGMALGIESGEEGMRYAIYPSLRAVKGNRHVDAVLKEGSEEGGPYPLGEFAERAEELGAIAREAGQRILPVSRGAAGQIGRMLGGEVALDVLEGIQEADPALGSARIWNSWRRPGRQGTHISPRGASFRMRGDSGKKSSPSSRPCVTRTRRKRRI